VVLLMMMGVKENRKLVLPLRVNNQKAGLLLSLFFVIFFALRNIGTETSSISDSNLRSNDITRTTAEDDFVYYFAYASDMSHDRLREGSSPDSVPVGIARLKGYKFGFTSFSKVWKGGVADIVSTSDNEDVVWGVLYKVPKTDMPNLDNQKGINKADPRYRKLSVVVSLAQAGTHSDHFEATTYCVTDNKREIEPVGPSKQYKKCILKGARESKLPKSYRRALGNIQDNGSKYRRKSVGTACD